ncbi:MAG: hypothetical protein BWX84_01127 [Verrucomicrobia bacterium ADurb.Bin118]|nr:MAG: hypothetical protein BWX84_01127 [Verrucomicrobia bacterium ADurb.Bin118]
MRRRGAVVQVTGPGGALGVRHDGDQVVGRIGGAGLDLRDVSPPIDPVIGNRIGGVGALRPGNPQELPGIAFGELVIVLHFQVIGRQRRHAVANRDQSPGRNHPVPAQDIPGGDEIIKLGAVGEPEIHVIRMEPAVIVRIEKGFRIPGGRRVEVGRLGETEILVREDGQMVAEFDHRRMKERPPGQEGAGRRHQMPLIGGRFGIAALDAPDVESVMQQSQAAQRIRRGPAQFHVDIPPRGGVQALHRRSRRG